MSSLASFSNTKSLFLQARVAKPFPCLALQIQDMVAIRHTACNEQQRTTMILLCEDGSLRIYMANVENTSYWLQPSLQPSSVISIMKPVRKRKAAAISKGSSRHFVTLCLDCRISVCVFCLPSVRGVAVISWS